MSGNNVSSFSSEPDEPVSKTKLLNIHVCIRITASVHYLMNLDVTPYHDTPTTVSIGIKEKSRNEIFKILVQEIVSPFDLDCFHACSYNSCSCGGDVD